MSSELKPTPYVILGLVMFVFAGLMFYISTLTGKGELTLIAFGLNALNLFWIIDLQAKIYKKKGQKEAKQ